MTTLILAGLALVLSLYACALLIKTGAKQRRIDESIHYANERGIRYDEIEIDKILNRSIQLESLVLWLALSFRVVSYDDDGTERVTWNTPIFPKEYPWGEDMPHSKTMQRLFHEVVGPPT